MESFLIRPLKALDPSVHVVTLVEEPRLTRYLVRKLDWLGAPPPPARCRRTPRQMPERIDGHIWLDPRNAMVIVRRMTEELSRADPATCRDLRQECRCDGQASGSARSRARGASCAAARKALRRLPRRLSVFREALRACGRGRARHQSRAAAFRAQAQDFARQARRRRRSCAPSPSRNSSPSS